MIDLEDTQDESSDVPDEKSDEVNEAYSLGGEDGQETTQEFDLEDALENLK